MLQENLTPEDLDIAISETTKPPDFLNVHQALKFQKSGGFPEINWRSFWIKNEEGKRVDFISRKFLLPGFRNFVLICSEADIRLNKSQVFDAFDKLNKEIQDMFNIEGPVIACFNPILDLFREWYSKKFPDFYLAEYPCFYYYMSEDQKNLLLEDTKDGIPLPEGYYWDEADPEKDAKVLFETWKHSSPGDYEGMKAKIRNLPSSMIRVKGTGEPVSFEHTDACGFLTHLFTQPPHRSKGLGAATEKNLCGKLIKAGMIPFKDVETNNPNVITWTDKSPYWTRWDDQEGNPVIMMFLKVMKKETSQD